MTALPVPARPQGDARLRPLPWRRMAWVIWRQHRFAMAGVAVFLGGLAAWLWITGLQLHHAYTAAAACRPANSPACHNLIEQFSGVNGVLQDGLVFQAVPALIGAFIGAPLLARELETGTFRYAWTQGFGRRRWALAKLVALAVPVAAVAGAMSVLLSWYYQPYFPARNSSLGLSEASPLAPVLFDLHGVTFAAWTLAAFAIGALAGMLIRRVVPAIGATLVAYTGLALLAGMYLRRHYAAPVVTTKLSLPSSAWITSQPWRDGSGHVVSQGALSQVLRAGPPSLAGKGGVPQALDVWLYLEHHGFTRWTSYQPAGRFWSFQWIETGWLFALSALLIGVTVWMVRRPAA
jgi:hypothetical protein